MKTGRLLDALERAERDGRPLETGGLRFTSLDRVMWPGRGLTKGDLVRYYVRVASRMLRHLHDRPLMLKRYHGDIDGAAVVQQRAKLPAPDAVEVREIAMADGERAPRYIGARPTLYHAAQLNAIELHCWHARVGRLDRPDWVVLDLDPSGGAGFRAVLRIAGALRDRIVDLGLNVAVKTSGSRGLHLHVPTGGKASWADAARLAKRIAERVAADEPRHATVERAVGERGRRVYIDHLQNARGKTAVAPYSVRARRGAPVAVPLAWAEVREGLRPDTVSMTDVPARIDELNEVWREALRPRGDLRRAIRRLES